MREMIQGNAVYIYINIYIHCIPLYHFIYIYIYIYICNVFNVLLLCCVH